MLIDANELRKMFHGLSHETFTLDDLDFQAKCVERALLNEDKQELIYHALKLINLLKYWNLIKEDKRG